MIVSTPKSTFAILSVTMLVLIFASVSHGAVVVFDRVTTVGSAVRIQVLTKGRFFAQGGQLVDIYLDDDHLKKILTGGDGYGYLKYTPRGAGLKEIKALSNGNRATGMLLVMNRSDKAIIIEIEGGFKESIFSEEIRENSQEAVSALSEHYKIIYLSRYVGKGISRIWLEKQNFPESVILRWKGSQLFAGLKKRGVQLHAIIGSAALVSAAKKHVENRFTFEKTKDAEIVQDWDEILKLLQESIPQDPEFQ